MSTDNTTENSDNNQAVVDLEGRIAAIEQQIYDNKPDFMLDILDQFVKQLNARLKSLEGVQGHKEIPHDTTDASDNDRSGQTWFMPDGNCEHTAAGQTKTINYQPGTGTHQRELQLVNADTLASSQKGQVPYIDVDSSGNGSLSWIYSDSIYKVLQLKGDGNFGFDWVRAH